MIERTDRRMPKLLGEIAATFGKVALALGVFAAVMFGWQQIQGRNMQALANSLPLPNETEQDGCAVWFVGSSSMRRWDSLQRDMRPWSAHNRSIGGATLDEIGTRFSNEENPQPPQAVVFYAGENDLAFGVPVKTAVSRFETFMRNKTERLGDVPVFFVSIKPSPTRWANRPLQAEFNDAVGKIARARADLYYVDTVSRFLTNGRLGDNYAEDGLHLNDHGYTILASSIRRALGTRLPAKLVRHCSRTEAAATR